MDKTLEEQQKAGEQVEQKMLDFLLQFMPAQALTVAEVKLIARMARQAAFDCFSIERIR